MHENEVAKYTCYLGIVRKKAVNAYSRTRTSSSLSDQPILTTFVLSHCWLQSVTETDDVAVGLRTRKEPISTPSDEKSWMACALAWPVVKAKGKEERKDKYEKKEAPVGQYGAHVTRYVTTYPMGLQMRHQRRHTPLGSRSTTSCTTSSSGRSDYTRSSIQPSGLSAT